MLLRVLCKGEGQGRRRLLALLLELPRGPAQARSGRQARLGAMMMWPQGRDAGQSGAVGGVGGMLALLLLGWSVLRQEVVQAALLHEELALPLEGGRAPRAGRLCASGHRDGVRGEAGPARPHRVRVGLLEQLAPAASVAHGEEGTGGRGQSHSIIVLVSADGSQVDLDLQTPCCKSCRCVLDTSGA